MPGPEGKAVGYLERNVRQTTTSRAMRACWLFSLPLFLSGPPQLSAQSLLDEETEQLLVHAVEAAAELDLYSARCRSDVSGRHTDNLNKELAGKFHMTVLEVEDDLFPERSYRRVKERLRRDFLSRLRAVGGCKAAKAAGMPEQLRARYDKLTQEIDRLP
jgi:hypothetical protein